MDDVVETEDLVVGRSTGWAQWGLGDLADVARWAAEFLSSATVVLRISLMPPLDQYAAPRVVAVVRDERALALLAERAMGQEQFPRSYGDGCGNGWFAEVDGVELHVQSELEALR